MGKLLKENQKATKENIVSILNDFRAVAKRTVDEAGKSYFQIAVEGYSLNEDSAVYDRLIQKLYAALPEDKKREIFNGLSDDEKNRVYRRAKDNIASLVRNNHEITDEKAFEILKQQNPNAKLQNAKNQLADVIANAESLDKAKGIASSFMSEESLSDPRFSELEIPTSYIDNRRDLFFNLVAENLPNETIDEIVTAADNYIPVSDRTVASIGTHTLSAPTEDMKQRVDNDASMSQEEKEQVKAIMDDINANIVTTDKQLKELQYYRESLETSARHNLEETREQAIVDMGMDPTAVVQTPDKRENYFSTIQPGKEADVERMREFDMRYSDQTKNAIKEVFAKFEEYGYAPTGSAEDLDTKNYAFSALNNTFEAYKQALDAHDEKESVRLAQEWNKHNTQMRDILDVVHNNFSMDESDIYQSNVGGMSNNNLPADMRQDVRSVSIINGLYNVYNYIKENDLDVDEFLASPLKAVEKHYTEGFEKVNSFELLKDQTSPASAIYDLQHKVYGAGRYGDDNEMNVIETLCGLEKDADLKLHNQVATFTFHTTVVGPYQQMYEHHGEELRAHKSILDRFLIVKEPVEDGRLLNITNYDSKTFTIHESQGFDECEYMANNYESPSDFLARIQENVVSYIETNELETGEGDRALSNSEFVEIAQKAAAKYLMVHGLGDALTKPNSQLTGDERALKDMFNFVNDGKSYVDKWIDHEYIERYSFEEKAAEYKATVTCNNPYKNMVAQNVANYRAQMNEPGDTSAYAQGESSRRSVEEKKAYLTQSFRNGEVPAMFYNARMQQLDNGDVNAQLPPFFAADDLGDVEDYIERYYDKETASELSSSEKKYLYDNFVERALEEKRQFLTKRYMLEKGLVERGQFFTQTEMEKIYTAANEEAHREEQERIAREEAERQAAIDKENALPHDERIKFVRKGETVTKDNFVALTERFISYSYRDKYNDPNKTEMENVRADFVRIGDGVRGKEFVDSLLKKLTPEQKDAIFKELPQNVKNEAYKVFSRRLDTAMNEIYNQKDKEYNAMPDGAEKDALKQEMDRIGAIKTRLTGKAPIEPDEALRMASPYISKERLKGIEKSMLGNFRTQDFAKNIKYIAAELPKYLKEEDMKALAKECDNFVLPRDRDPKYMGSPQYTKQTLKALDDIQKNEDLKWKDKLKMADDLQKANEFLLKPDDPSFSSYTENSRQMQNASLHKERDAGAEQMKKEGLDPTIVETTINPRTNETLVVLKEGKEEEMEKWNNAEFKMSPETKTAILHVFAKMHEFGYDSAGVVGEEGESKEYGLKPLANTIREYKKAIESGDALKIAEAAGKMNEERAHVDELLGYIKEHFPVTEDNFAMAGNIEVVRNELFPPYLRYEDAAVTHLSSMYIAMNFAKANGIEPEEFLEHPAKYMRETFQEKMSQNLDHAIAGKTGAQALFEVCKNSKSSPRVSYGAPRTFEAFRYMDIDPEVRAHNAGLGEFFDTTVMNNAQMEINDRKVAFKDPDSHLERLFFMNEPQKDASILGISYYVGKDLAFTKPQPFDEFAYIKDNGRSVSEMKAQIDANIAEYLKLNAEIRVGKDKETTQAISQERLVAIAQTAAKKVLIAKSAERGTPDYRALQELLTDANKYIKDVVANSTEISDETKKKIQVTAKGKTSFAKEVDEFNAKVENFYKTAKDELDLKPDKDFNDLMKKQAEELKKLEDRIAARKQSLGADADFAKDDELQVLEQAKSAKEKEITNQKSDYLKQLEDDVASGRIPESYRVARSNQVIMRGEFDTLPTPFKKSGLMSKEEYIATLANNAFEGNKIDLNDYDEADRDALYEAYVERESPQLLQEAEEFATRRFAKEYGLTDGKEFQAQQGPVAQVQAEPEKEVEVPKEFSGRLFKKGEEVTKENIVAKILALEKAPKNEPQGKNWLEKREFIERAENNVRRLGVFFSEALKVMTPESQNALMDAVGRERLEEKVKHEYWRVLRQKTGAAKELSDRIHDNMKTMSLAEVKQAASPYLTAEEKANPQLEMLGNVQYNSSILNRDPKLWNIVIGGLKPEDVDRIAKIADNTVVVAEKGLEENLVGRYEKEVNSVKEITDNMKYLHGKELTDEDKLKIRDTLEEARSHMADLDPNYRDALEKKRGGRENGDYGMNYAHVQNAFGEMEKEGISASYEEETNLRLTAWTTKEAGYTNLNIAGKETQVKLPQLDESGQKDFDRLHDMDFEYRPETKQAILDVFKKMDEYGYDKVPFEGEEGYKIYGLRLYDNARIDFQKQIESDDPAEKLKAVESAERMNKEFAHTKELLGMIHKSFAVEGDTVMYPGNLDVSRNAIMPPEFREDIAGISTLNGLYMSYRMMKQMGVSPEEFVNAPKKALNNWMQKTIDNLNFNKALTGKSGADAIHEVGKEFSFLINRPNSAAASRAVEAMSKLEKDPDMSRKNSMAEYGYRMTTVMLTDGLNERTEVFNAAQNRLDRFLLVKDPQQNGDLLGLPLFDHDGTKRVGEAKYFDEAKYLANNDESIEGFMARMNEEMVKSFSTMKDSFGKTMLNSKVLIDAYATAASKFAISLDKSAQRGPAYEQLKQLATNGGAYIKNVLTEAKNRGEFEHDVNEFSLNVQPSNPYIIRGYADYIKNAAKNAQRAAKPVISEDERLNRTLKRLEDQIGKIERKGPHLATEAEKRTLNELLAQKNALVAERKEALLDAYAQGRVPKEYVERRTAQLENGPYDKNVPLFEADKPMTRREFDNKRAEKGIFATSDADYAKYLKDVANNKKAYFLKGYMEQEGLTQVEKKLNREEREQERQRQARLQEKEKSEKQVNNAGVQKEAKVENVEVNLDEEEVEVAPKEEKKDDYLLEQEVDAPENDKDLGERFTIDLDEDDIELNNQLLGLNDAVQREKNVDPLKR